MLNPDKGNRKEIPNLSKIALEHGGSITPLDLPAKETLGDGVMNGSILFHNNKWFLNLRRVGYLFYHAEKDIKFPSPWGPLIYMNPENDVVLRTKNYVCELDDANGYKINKWTKTDTSKLDVPPLWEFIGLEDARLQHWGGKMYQTGVRRDTTPNGEGRMELSTIEESGCCDWKETERVRVSPPDPRTHAQGGSYCEKNWMPVNDMPYHYVKWTSPTELVKVDPKKGTSKIVKMVEQPHIKTKRDMRGSSNVIKYKDHWVAIIHEVDLWFNEEEQKNSIYYHRFVVWDKDWKIKYISPEFDFMTGRIEFTCGLGFDGNNFLIPVGFQDHTSFMLQLPPEVFENITGMSDKPLEKIESFSEEYKDIYDFVKDPYEAINAFVLGERYFNKGCWASALGFFLRAAEFTDNPILEYNAFYMVCRSFANKNTNPECEGKMWKQLINLNPKRPEGWASMAGYHSWRNQHHEAYFYLKLGYELADEWVDYKLANTSHCTKKDFKINLTLFGGSYGLIKEKKELLKDFKNNKDNYPKQLHGYMESQVKRYKI